MTLFNHKTFTVPASGGNAKTCQEQGHAFPDIKGKCVRCGEKVRYAVTPEGQAALRESES